MSNSIPQAAIDAAADAVHETADGQALPEYPIDFATAALEAAMPHLRVTDLGERADRVMESQWQAGYVAGKNDAFSGTTSARRIVRIAEEGKTE